MNRQKGVALIVVLLVVALVSISAADMGSRLQLQVKRSISLKDNNQAFWYAVAAEQFAQKTLAQLILEGNDTIHINEPWAQQDIQFPVEGGMIEATLEDLQSCFNLNALQDQSGNSSGNNNQTEIRNAFLNLLNTQAFNIPSLNQETLRDSLVDWLDDDSILSGNYGAEDSDYESLLHPYLAANSLMASKSELRLVKGVEMAWLHKIMPLVCVIPGETALKLNVNTLTAEKAPLLAAMTGLDVSTAESVISGIPFADKNAFLADPAVNNMNLTDQQKELFDVTTRFFILHVKTTYNNATFKMSSVFKVASDNSVHLVRREFGGKL